MLTSCSASNNFGTLFTLNRALASSTTLDSILDFLQSISSDT
jgi:hypothetical protein